MFLKYTNEEELYDAFNGKASTYPAQWFRKRGLLVPDWALKCSNMAFRKSYYGNLEARRKRLASWFLSYKETQVNSEGTLLNYVRIKSKRHMVTHLGFEKIPGYNIHHCFSYDDPERFVYLPKALHLAIHRFLRLNKIDAKTDHFEQIRAMLEESRVAVYLIDHDEVKLMEKR